MNLILTPDEITRLTGYRTATHQSRFLAAHGLPHRRNKAGQIVLARTVAEAWLGVAGAKMEEGSDAAPNFGALRLLRGGVGA